MLSYSFLDLEAGHSGRNGVCDITNADESQGSLVDFIYDENSSEESDDKENEVDMANIYLTSLLPLSQQPEGFGFYDPKYNNKGFKLRKNEIQLSQACSPASPQSPVLLCFTPIQLPAPLPPRAVCSDKGSLLPIVNLANKARLKLKK